MKVIRHGFLNEEKGPNDMRGIALRVLLPHPTAMDGFARMVWGFWASREQFEADDAGLHGMRKSTLQNPNMQYQVVIHNTQYEALEAAHGQEVV